MTLPYQDARDLVDAARARGLDLGKALIAQASFRVVVGTLVLYGKIADAG